MLAYLTTFRDYSTMLLEKPVNLADWFSCVFYGFEYLLLSPLGVANIAVTRLLAVPTYAASLLSPQVYTAERKCATAYTERAEKDIAQP